MKNYYLPVLCLFFLAACEREMNDNNRGIKSFDSFVVSFEDEMLGTKVIIDANGEVNWHDFEEIGVYSDMHAPVRYQRWSDGTFHGETISGTKFFAFYPFNGMKYNEDSPTNLECSSVGLGSHGKGQLSIHLPMVSSSTDNSFVFKQVCGLLHFKVKIGDNHSIGVSLRGNNNEVFGPGVIDMMSITPKYSVIGSDGATIVSTMSDGEESDIEDIMIPVPEMLFSEGFTLCFYLTDSSTGDTKYYEKATHKPVKITRGRMKSFALFDLEQEVWEEEEEKEFYIKQDRAALMALYNSLGGDQWLNNTNWGSDRPLSEWYGVYVNERGRVDILALENNHLRGTIPEEIGNLSELRFLHMWSYNGDPNANIIEGTIPPSIGNLSELRVLNMRNNRLSGRLPDTMRNLKSLEHLLLSAALDEDGNRLASDALSGEFPEWICEMECLESIDFQCQGFYGQVPSLAKLTHLRELSLNGNSFTGPLPTLPKSTSLYTIHLAGNHFSGAVPECYSYCLDNEDFCFIILRYNNLSGELPQSIIQHPRFPEYAGYYLAPQWDGYKIEIETIPASRYSYPTLDGSFFNLGEAYSSAEYTMLVRWAEWCIPSRSFIPLALSLANKYRDYGLQTIWTYAGGDEIARKSFMEEMGLNNWPIHLIESFSREAFYHATDHAIWTSSDMIFGTPFVEIVDKKGEVIFIDDPTQEYRDYPISYNLNELEEYLANLFSGSEFLYESSDYLSDGRVHTLQLAKYGKGINVVLMGDAFSDRMIADGTYDTVMQKAVAALFSEEPYKSLKDYFNVYYIDVVSKNEVYYGESALSTWYGNGTSVGGDDAKVFDYAKTVLSDQQIDDALILVMMNRDYYAGTCYMYYLESSDYGRGPAIAYFPTSNDTITFDGLVSHEAGGHGFAKLADEYAYQNMGAMPEAAKEERILMVPYGWWKNADFTGDPLEVKWAQFIADSRYDAENVGCYEGAFTYWIGAWRPTEESIMNHNTGGFNAPSRYAIWYRIHKLAYGDEWQGTYEDFVEYDKINRTPAAIAKRKSQRRNFVEKDFEPLAPPVIVNKDWREMLK